MRSSGSRTAIEAALLVNACALRSCRSMTGPKNLITDVPGVLIGNAHDEKLASGVSVALFEEAAVASVAVLGGAPAGRDLECLEPERSVPGVDAIVLSGGSGFGLDAASGVQARLRERGRGFLVRSAR